MEKESEKKEPTKNEALRPTLRKTNAEDKGIEVDPNHGLFNFFRKVKDDTATSGFKYITVEPTNDRLHARSRAWTTAELRRKSFRDLHIIWYMCQRERNLLATQKAELRRLHHLASVAATPITLRARMCRKTCARIKFVLNERRLAYLDASIQLQWAHRPGYKDPAKKPEKTLKKGPQMTEQVMKRRMQKLSKKGKLKHLHPELRKRPVMMLRWAPRKGRASPMRFDSDYPVNQDVEDENGA
ncbi:54S ribosomal protein L4 mitochondrial [Serendipita sp. 399]|nr:54S ribosomal protein L4 mitochondrial [Serendipita sp. 399]